MCFLKLLFKSKKAQTAAYTPVTNDYVDDEKMTKCITYVECLYPGYTHKEYMMAIIYAELDLFENYNDFYSDLEKINYREMAKIRPIVNVVRLPFSKIIEIPTGEYEKPFYVKYYIKKHDKFLERIRQFFDRLRLEKKITQ